MGCQVYVFEALKVSAFVEVYSFVRLVIFCFLRGVNCLGSQAYVRLCMLFRGELHTNVPSVSTAF